VVSPDVKMERDSSACWGSGSVSHVTACGVLDLLSSRVIDYGGPTEAGMAEHGTNVRDVARLEVARAGRVEETGDRLMPYRLLDGQGVEVAAVTEFLRHSLLMTPARRHCAPTPTNCCRGTGSCSPSRFPGILPDAWRPAIRVVAQDQQEAGAAAST
jgi:hypothetical protein